MSFPSSAQGCRPQSLDIAGHSIVIQDAADDNTELKRATTIGMLPSPRQYSKPGSRRSCAFAGLFPPRHQHERRPQRHSTTTVQGDNGSSSEEDLPDGQCVDGEKSASFENVLEDTAPYEAPYHVFTRRQKWQLVYIVSLAGLFSPLSSNIYFPALRAIATDINTTISLVALTVTVYMIVQGLAPSFWGPLSDTCGRRVTFMGTFAVYLLSNIGLALSKDFASLMVFRAIQAAGSAATISVGAGVIGDITTAKERGGFMGSFGGIRMLGQSIGPVVGGIITEYFGFHAIFWFLFVLGSLALGFILLFLPETLRRIGGDGSVPLRGIHRPFICTSFKEHWQQQKEGRGSDESDELTAPTPKMTMATITSPLRFLAEKDVMATLSFGAIVYAVWSMVTSSTTVVFQPRYGLTNLQVGLIFLPNGAACVTGSYVTGHLLDRDYRIVEAEYRVAKGIAPDAVLDRKRLADFPVSRARLRSSSYLVVLFVCAVAGYGFAVMKSPATDANNMKAGMALPLFLQFVIAFTATAIFTQNSALVVDLYPGASASASAVNNLMRCAVGAVGVAVVQLVIDEAGEGMTFLALAIITAALSPLLWLEWVYGEHWRRERIERIEREKADRRASEGGESARRGD
ncbi:major facilitator superfamily domain-containing protein [Bombardia bombarda]|uniref:Major facilitator superfamily domain-containing protein n=1 Tax=Bombardia bombarda TaxID=252184 RepID=A0AA40C404_9PEZI|nr:major facilitator superfamily domain-containing protein [Bombardia bombarda]